MKEKQEELKKASEALLNNKKEYELEHHSFEPIDEKKQNSDMFQTAMATRYGADLGSSLKETPDELKAIVFNRAIKASDIDTNLITDGYHTFNELYEFRKMYNAVLFNSWAKEYMLKEQQIKNGFTQANMAFPLYDVHKSWKHYDGEWCFEQEKVWFIVSAMLPTGLISNHYKAEDWDLFKVPEVEKALFKFDGHTAQDVLTRLKAL